MLDVPFLGRHSGRGLLPDILLKTLKHHAPVFPE
jgi:hypothetical protein